MRDSGEMLPVRLVIDRAFYSTAYNIGRQFSDFHTLLNTEPMGLIAGGVAPDSATRLVRILQHLNIPVNAAAVPACRSARRRTTRREYRPDADRIGFGPLVHRRWCGKLSTIATSEPRWSSPDHAGARGRDIVLGRQCDASFTRTTSGSVCFPKRRWVSQRQVTRRHRTNRSPKEASVSVRACRMVSSVKSLLFGGGSQPLVADQSGAAAQQPASWFTEDNAHTLKLTSELIRDTFQTDYESESVRRV